MSNMLPTRLSDDNSVSKLMFFTDLCEHMNDLNAKLQVSGKTHDVTCGYITAYEKNL